MKFTDFSRSPLDFGRLKYTNGRIEMSLKQITWLGVLSFFLGACDPNPQDFSPLDVQDFVFVNEKSIVISTHSGALLQSADTGASWSLLAQFQGEGSRRAPFIAALVTGTNETLWGEMLIPEDDVSSISVGGPLVFSNDAGRTFSRAALPETCPVALLVPAEGRQPFALCINGQLLTGDTTSGSPSFTPIGFPNPDEAFGTALFCEGRILVASLVPIGTTRVWSTPDLGTTWFSELDTLDPIGTPLFACAPDGDMWVVERFRSGVFYYNSSANSWISVVNSLGDWHRTAITAGAGELYVAGDHDEIGLIFRITIDGSVEELRGFPDNAPTALELDANGALWAASNSGLYKWTREDDSWIQIWP